MSPLLQMRGVRLVYGRRRPTLAIERLDLEIEQGNSLPWSDRPAAASRR